MHKLKKCEELITGNGRQYIFAGTFGNIEAVSFVAGDPGALFARLVDGELPPADIRSVIFCCVEKVDGKPVEENQREDIATQFVEDMGLQDCSLLARHLLSYGIIGDVKKKQIDRQEAARGLIRKLNPLTLIRFAPRGLLLVALSLTSTALACLTLMYVY